MRLKLFSKKECPFCWQVKIALKYFDIDYELVEWKIPEKDFLSSLKPQQSLPVLQHGDLSIWDSVSIVYYLEELTSAEKSLFPGDIKDRTKARLLQTYSNSIAGKGLREVVFEKRGRPEAEWDSTRIDQGRQRWHKSLDWLEMEIETENNFLTAGFSVADAALLPRFGLAEHYGAGVGKNHPKLYNWFQNGRRQPIYSETAPW